MNSATQKQSTFAAELNNWLAATTRGSMITRGILLTVLGILLIIYPGEVTKWITILIGAAMLVYAGVIAASVVKLKGIKSGVMITFAILLAVFGFFGVIYPLSFANFFLILLGVWSLFSGVTALAKVIPDTQLPTVKMFNYLSAGISIAVGIVLILFPFLLTDLLFMVTGIILLVYAASDFTCAFYLIPRNPKSETPKDDDVIQ